MSDAGLFLIVPSDVAELARLSGVTVAQMETHLEKCWYTKWGLRSGEYTFVAVPDQTYRVTMEPITELRK